MSDERLEELGLERRAFLKKAMVAGFVAPVIASFAFEGTAVADSQFCGNQHTYPNQVHSGQNDQGQNNNDQ
jgi:hypothetical protein